MKRPRFGSRSRVSRDVSQLSWLATGLAESGGKLEDAFWEARLGALVEQLLALARAGRAPADLQMIAQAMVAVGRTEEDVIQLDLDGERLEIPHKKISKINLAVIF